MKTQPASLPHALLPPSSAYRWSTCTASVDFIEDNRALLPKEGSAYADEGSVAHEWARRLLTGEARLIDSTSADMLTHVRAYVEFVQARVAPEDKLLVEQRVPLFYLPGSKGTVDAALIKQGPRPTIIISDLKYGAGVSVYAKENKQLAIYAESIIQMQEAIEPWPDDALVVLRIFQPRDRNDSNPIRLWAITRAELREFLKPVEAAAKLIQSRGKTVFAPDPDGACKFCPAAGICTARANHGLEVIEDATGSAITAVEQKIVLPNPSLLSRDKRQKVLAAKKAIAEWLEAVENQEVNDLLGGAAPIEFKLVEGKTNRVWRDEEAAEKLLLTRLKPEEIRPPGKLLSVKQAEDKFKGEKESTQFLNKLAALIEKPEGKPSLVPVSDKRPALLVNKSEGLTAIESPADCI